MPVAFETRDTPPKGSDLASAAAHTRRPRSSSMLHIVRYFSWMARSCFPPMQEEYNLCVDCSSYLCAIPKRAVNLRSVCSRRLIVRGRYFKPPHGGPCQTRTEL